MIAPAIRLHRGAVVAPATPVLDDAQRGVVDHAHGVLRVLAGPGTGKTTTLVEAVVDRVVNRGVPVENILMLTFSRAAAGAMRDRVTARLQRTVSEPVARTFHSYAFGLVRRAAVLAGEPPPRLLSGSEQDVLLREMLAGRLEQGLDDWPVGLRAAVRTKAFADEVRELLMRCIERDLQPPDLVQLARRHQRPEWSIGAAILREYYEVTALKTPGAFDAAELIQRAKAALSLDPKLLAAERAVRRRIFVDEYQDTDQSQVELLELIAEGADELVIVGDPDQAIYAFRGAEENALAEVEQHFGAPFAGRRQPSLFGIDPVLGNQQVSTVTLTVSRRSGDRMLRASRRIADRLGGGLVTHRRLTAVPDAPAGDASVSLFASPTDEAGHIASVLRRAHVSEGVPWSEMAVLVRSAGPSVDSLRRALVADGVPVGEAVRGPLSEQTLIGQLLALLRCIARPDGLDEESATGLLTGAVGRADPLQVMRARRFLRRPGRDGASPHPAGPGLADLITDENLLPFVPPGLDHSVRRLHRVCAAGRTAARTPGAAAEDVLWAIWDESGLAGRLEHRSVAGGPSGARADRDLDAVIALFNEAAKVRERTPGADTDALYDWVAQLQFADADADATRGAADDVVPILTVHAAKGLEWEVVCVAGVQEGRWPDLRHRGSLLGTDLLLDLRANRAPVATGLVRQRLAEERRLFYVAVTRARRRLVVTAHLAEDLMPSRFLDELDPPESSSGERPVERAAAPFGLAGMVAELRAALVDPGTPVPERDAAAAHLARLAGAGVPGAAPQDWWGLAPVSSDRPIRPRERGPVPIRPSKFEAYADCELRALLSEVGAVDSSDSSAASLGVLLHRVAERAPVGATVDELQVLLEADWDDLDFGAPWHATAERARAQRMITELARWLTESRRHLRELGREVPFAVDIGDARLSGTVDRLELDESNRLVVIDVKTSKNKPTRKAVEDHPQLAAYQLAIAEGGLTEGVPAEPGGAVLMQIGAPSPGEQWQPAIAELPDPDWVRRELARIAAVLRGAEVTATPGAACQRCAVRSSCPAQLEGRQVTS